MYTLVDFDGYLISAITSTSWYKYHYDAKTKADDVDYINGLVEVLAWYQTWIKHMDVDFPNAHLFMSLKKDDKYHRHLLYPEYKLNRAAPSDKVIIWRRLSEAFKELGLRGLLDRPIHVVEGYEADDTVAVVADYIHQQNPRIRVNVHSIDKDLQTVPNTVMYSPTNPEGLYVDKTVAHQSIKYQMVVGDSTDGYKGLKGHGPKAYQDFWVHLTNKEFKQEYIYKSSTEYFNMMYDLVRMLDMKSAKRLMPIEDYNKTIELCEVIYGRCEKTETDESNSSTYCSATS